MRRWLLVVLMVVAGSVAGCVETGAARRSTPGTSETSLPARLTLRVGETRDLGVARLRVEQVVEDSRCPRDAVCVSAGRVRVRFEVQPADAPAQHVVLTLDGARAAADEAQAHLAGLRLTLLAVEPVPRAAVPIRADQYRITCLVEPAP
ncbi:hypothetical protein [Kallotenue papyrolyticum]|uniref:hypothetical protein n=1 Tax=Kallotenue papyrolyticum TaxID=1325125 RepID=UPI0004785D54|nr:hypothetical protein [Kallotenue papyrolyticum]